MRAPPSLHRVTYLQRMSTKLYGKLHSRQKTDVKSGS